MIIEDFLDSFQELKDKSLTDCFADEVNPVDGVVYPLICRNIPLNVEKEILDRLEEMLDRQPMNPLMFMRQSPKGIPCPHKVHSDISMGTYSLMLYINDAGNGCGTSMVKHDRTGITYSPQDDDFVRIIEADQNNDDAWSILELIEMKPNRGFIFRADALHRAEPVGGFGEGKEARVVLTCFFS